jgi:SnoaL-like domain
MEPTEQWEVYAACWSMPSTERRDRLRAVVDGTVVYRDPGTILTGPVAFEEYMDSFGSTFPGARFVIDHVLHHHGRSLASWHQVAADGTTAMEGWSCAIHSDDGRLCDITGFFSLP